MQESEAKLLLMALSFAAQRHRDQRRKDAEASPYINHPIDLANVLCNEGGICDAEVLCAALLHDTVEDTDTMPAEVERVFGRAICGLVMEVTDDKRLPKPERKRLQIEHAGRLSPKARLVKIADKICNLRDIAQRPPSDWSLERCQAYFDWARRVVDQLRGTNPVLESLFDEAYGRRPG
jgi:guanosine-3',5'-bis(diphosphate) 3'-pyrophosphohydrolase